MYQLPLRFVSVGPDFTVCATRIICVFDPKTNPGREEYRRSKLQGKLYDARAGRAIASVIVLDNGHSVASPLRPITIFRRLQALDDSYIYASQKVSAAIRDRDIAKAKEAGIEVYTRIEDYELEDEEPDEDDVEELGVGKRYVKKEKDDLD